MQLPHRTLFVLRHAKSSWDEPGLDDHDRPLAPRGRKATALLAEYARREHIGPELVLCSSARRARETLERTLDHPNEVHIEAGLYGASAGELIERLRRVPAQTRSVMLIGHNPSLHDLVRIISTGDEPETFPTGALATLTITGPWRTLGPGCATLGRVVRPRDLH